MKKVTIFMSCFLLLGILGSGFFIMSSSAEDTPPPPPPQEAIKQCLDAKENKTESAIEKFYCPDTDRSSEYIAYQVAVDVKFKLVDKKVEDWFKKFSSEGEYKGKTPAELGEIILENFGTSAGSGFVAEYRSICGNPNDPGSAAWEVAKFFGGLTTNNGITDVILGNTACNSLLITKLRAYQDAAWSVATRNIVENFQSDKKKFADKIKDRYDGLLSKLMVYIGKLSEIKDKWDKKTPKTQ